MSTDLGPGPEVSRRLGYLFKHAQMRMAELTAQALAPFDIDGRELGILLVIASHEPGSQQEAAQRLGIDRTSMVTRLDELEAKGLVSRHPHAEDRRRNIVELTPAGRDIVEHATEASERAEAALLASLTSKQGEQLRQALQAIVFPAQSFLEAEHGPDGRLRQPRTTAPSGDDDGPERRGRAGAPRHRATGGTGSRGSRHGHR